MGEHPNMHNMTAMLMDPNQNPITAACQTTRPVPSLQGIEGDEQAGQINNETKTLQKFLTILLIPLQVHHII